ncbi:2-hydroxyacid dehydrogenase [Brumicola nitratireducens]|uniref:D-isomer specific 2-hydroxyacid dehydrogenase, NAD-binding protein n=1 Tax=Glaciecola nitratireducens (strain JCM 12485 / KCTC 12276 / FR1064) TaxID=1085623 RepID=G4QII0_GLANF|nr:2-hydroxyacid dehydrogenase [Glaciecola nitratireducens]AEP30894.1 D-isomer specific 2-hydroxyacid dehydrogenase, NAD-binding protein [Glaciecola nitratireducens FR1064]
MSIQDKERMKFINELLAQYEGISAAAYQQIIEALEVQQESFGYNAKKQLKVAMFDARSYDIAAFDGEFHSHIQAINIPSSLNLVSAIQAKGCLAVCVFVNDECNEPVIAKLAAYGVKLIALRCAGFNNVDLEACKKHKIDVVRVPEYSPYAVAEHTVALMMMLNRKLHQAYMRNKNGQYVLDGLVGFDMFGKTVGVIGVGKIGRCLINILLGFGCKVLAYDINVDEAFQANPNVNFVSLDQLLESSDIITLHAPLTKQTQHVIDENALNKMKEKVMIINTSRGGLIDTKALVQGLKSGQIGSAGLDVYEEEASIFFHDKSGEVITDDVFARLTTFNNVVITSHQGFLTKEALSNIAQTTLDSFAEFIDGKRGSELSYSIGS